MKKNNKKCLTTREMIKTFDQDKLNYKAFSMKIGDEYKSVSYGKLQKAIKNIGNALLNMGIKKGDKIGLLSENRLEWPVVFLSLASIGVVIVPVDIFLGKDELKKVFQESKMKQIFTSVFFIDKVIEVNNEIDLFNNIICFDQHQKIYDDLNSLKKPGSNNIDFLNFDKELTIIEKEEISNKKYFKNQKYIYYGSILNIGKKLFQLKIDYYSDIKLNPKDTLMLSYMHGKQFAVLSHFAILSNMHAINSQAKVKRMVEKDVLLSTIPFHHTFPIMACILIVLDCYGESVILTTFKTKEIVDTIDEVKASLLPTVPILLEKIFHHLKKNNRKLNSIKYFISGGAPIKKKTLDGLNKIGIKNLQGYGLTEYSPVISSNSIDFNKNGSIGKVLPGVEIKIVPVDEEGNGELLVKGPSIMDGYYNMQDATNKVIDSDGWLHTGDIASIDDDGFIFITGRLKKIIVSNGGKNIYPEDIKEILLESKYISEVKILPKIDEKKGEYPHALIKPDFKQIQNDEKKQSKRFSDNEINNIILKELKKLTKEKAFYKVPGDFEVVYKNMNDYPDWDKMFMFNDFYQNSDKVINNHDLIREKKYYTEKVEKYLEKTASKILGIPETEMDKNESFMSYLSSIELVNVSKKLEEELHIELLPTILFEYTNISDLSYYFSNKYLRNLIDYFGIIPAELLHNESSNKVIEKNKNKKKVIKNEKIFKSDDGIAVIGINGVLPGSDNIDQFWENILEGKNLISEIPKDRWDWNEYYGDPVTETNKTNVKWGGFINDIDKFDSMFFGISPTEAKLMDPQQRIFLQTVWKTIEDASIKASDISGTDTGLFVGVSTFDYFELLTKYSKEVKAHILTGISHSIIANRISYFLNLHGPSEAIDTACSSSLVAIHKAVGAILSGNCEMAIAGGVNLLLTPNTFIGLSNAGMLSPDGQCKTFDKDANGYVRGEGSGAVLLKSLSKAERDGDYIYGVIKSSSVNHGGKANTLTSPNPKAQKDLIVNAFNKTNIDPSEISYIETHGTGTELGDPIEFNGLTSAFAELIKKPKKKNYCGIGSVKTNIGHLEAASGIAGFLKILMAFKHKKIPASINFNKLNPYIKIDDSPFYITNKSIDWKTNGDGLKDNSRKACISSFGFGGANAHLIVEEYKNNLDKECSDNNPHLFVLSAKNNEQLHQYALNIKEYIEKNSENENIDFLTIGNISYTLMTGREVMPERLAIIAQDIEELKQKINIFLEGKSNIENCYNGNSKNIKLIRPFICGKEGSEFLSSIINNKNYEKIAQVWILGAEIDWELLNTNSNINRRIPLPTYPFKKNRHWIDLPESKPASEKYLSDEKVEISDVPEARKGLVLLKVN
ncbi:MAG: AMP-binding protein [Desulfobacterales bacterium]|nr:AMP-binding protein [Desulfobacterales bacterium]